MGSRDDRPPAPDPAQAAALPRPLSWQERALLHGPDRRCAWVVVGTVTLASPVDDLRRRITALHAAVPLVGARLQGDRWVPGAPPVARPVADPMSDGALTRPFDLVRGPPVRLLHDAAGRQLAVAVHHAAFDGLGLAALLRGLLGGELPEPAAPRPPGPPEPPWPGVRRLLRPADPVRPSDPPPTVETRVARDVTVVGAGVTARLAAAVVGALATRQERLGRPFRRVGVSIGLGGPPGDPEPSAGSRAGYVSSYRRVDVAPDEDVAARVAASLAEPSEPTVMRLGPVTGRLIAPVAERASDTVLVSNVGRRDLPGARRFVFHPVARGRSAVAIGLGGVAGGVSTVTLRARALDEVEARSLLDDVADRLEGTARDPRQ